MFADLVYLARVARSLWGPGVSWRRAAAVAPAVAVVVMGATMVYGSVPAATAAEQDEVGGLEVRASRASAALSRVGVFYEVELAPLERVLRAYREDSALARRIAVALVREGRAAEVPPHLLLAVLLVENPWIDPDTVSPVGARGLMQVMPLHEGKWRACPPRLDGIDANICYGARIFGSLLRQQDGQVERALLRYNGCVNGTNTPNCRQYANHVFARFGRASVLAMD